MRNEKAGKGVNISRLPFVVQPTAPEIYEEIGSVESGKIRIKRRGYLTTGEKAFMQQAIGSDEATIKIVSISRLISSEYEYSLDKGYADTLAILSGKGSSDDRLKEIETRYMAEFTELMTALTNIQVKEKIIGSLCLLKYRCDPEIDINEVLVLHPDIIDGLWELYSLEEKKSLEALSTSESIEGERQELSVDEIEKKPSKRRSQT